MSQTHHDSHGSDQKAAFAGMLITTAALFVIAYGIVLWTNAKFAGKEHGAAPSAQQTSH